MTDTTSEPTPERPASVDDLAGLRSTLETWIDRAAEAVWNFHVDDHGSFWNNSNLAASKPVAPHITTTARCYIALLYAHRARGESASPPSDDWVKCFDQFIGQPHMTWSTSKAGADFAENADADPNKKKSSVNTFDVAHLADFLQVADYIDRFALRDAGLPRPDVQIAEPRPAAGVQAETGGMDGVNENAPPDAAKPDGGDTERKATEAAQDHIVPDVATAVDKTDARSGAAGKADSPAARGGKSAELRDAVVAHLNVAIANALEASDTFVSRTGEVQFDKRAESAHYFATLHALRALHALGAPLPPKVSIIVDGARAFGVEQCFYYQRGMTHRQDAIRLAFACSIYAIYGEHVDQELCLAMIEALHDAQQENGSWPASHPIQRKNGHPWRIASHEVALCLTWLYFQPRVPDAARPLLIAMMRRYLEAAVAPTFFRAPADSGSRSGKRRLDGWQDDHTVGTETTVGWATAIICHFLANFSVVLDDWINRHVIEDLGLALATENYRIDDVVSKPAPRWQRDFGMAKKKADDEEDEQTGQSAVDDGEDQKAGVVKADAEPVAESQPDVQDEARPVREDEVAVARTSGEVWPDLPPHAWARDPADEKVLAASIHRHWTDPTLGAGIAKGLATKALLPILDAADQRPRRDSFAALIPGEPGTRKTSLVDRVAEVVIWPKVAVPASLIFAKGFDRMEAQANDVFDRLNHLRRCVIFFDEFEEFFVSRQPDQGVAVADTTYKHRTIAAFTTSAMLPRLQQLHDVRRCLIFLATNHLDKLDSAIKRRGRFDFQIEVNHPKAARLAEYLEDVPKDARKRAGLHRLTKEEQETTIGIVRAAVDKVASVTPDAKIRFAWMEELLSRERGSGDADHEARVFARLRRLMEDEHPDDPPMINAVEPG